MQNTLARIMSVDQEVVHTDNYKKAVYKLSASYYKSIIIEIIIMITIIMVFYDFLA